MNEAKEIEIWEFERKSFLHWRPPFLSDDPPHFVSRDKQQLNRLNEYQLNELYTFDVENDWIIDKQWIYSDHFRSIQWSKNEFSSCHLCRKRSWKRIAKKQAHFISKSINMPKIHLEETHSEDVGRNTMYYEHIVHEIETYESLEWKPYKNGWFDTDLNPIETIKTPFDIVLNNHQTSGAWKWAEHWSCVDIKHILHPNDSSLSLQSTKSTQHTMDVIHKYDHYEDESIDAEAKQMEEETQKTTPIKKTKKKRIRIKKNAKKWLKKMKGNKLNKGQNKAANESISNINRDATDLLSVNEQNELFELFGSIDRGWCYSVTWSTNDSDWKPEHNIITQCNLRRRTWIRAAIYDDVDSYNYHSIHIQHAPMLTLSKSESLSQSILRSKNKANDLLASIDEYLISGRLPQNEHKAQASVEDNDNNDKECIGSYIMKEILNGLLWHSHLSSISNVVERLPNEDGTTFSTLSDETKIGKLYFMDAIQCRDSKINDLMNSLKRLHFDDDKVCEDIDCNAICTKIYSHLLCDLLYECTFHESKEIYCNSQRVSLLNRINEVIVLYSALKRSKSVSTVTEIVLMMSAFVGFMEKAHKDEEDTNPLWIFDDLLNIGQEYQHATDFELACLFMPDLLTNLKQFVYILSTLNKDNISKTERVLCGNTTKRMLAVIETYFHQLHDQIRSKTVVQLLQIFISLTHLYEEWIDKSPKTTFKEIRMFLSEYHKISIERALDNITNDNHIISMFFICDDAHSEYEHSSEELYTIVTPQNEHDMNHISCKLAREYSDARDASEDKHIMKERQIRLAKHFSNVQVQNIWWEYIEDILNLMDIDYDISMALFTAKIFQQIPCAGIERLAEICGKEFTQSFRINPHALDIAYKLLLCGAHKIQDRLEVIGHKIRTNDSQHTYDVMDVCVKHFSFVQYQIFERLSYWMDLAINRVAIWIKRAAEQETWRVQHSSNLHDSNRNIRWAAFVTDSFSFIHNEIDAFFEHLIRFPHEAMSLATVFFQRLLVLVETILHLIERSMRDCTVLDNMNVINDADTNGTKKRKATKCNVRDEMHKLEERMNKNGVLKKSKRKQLMDAFLREYLDEMHQSNVKRKDILEKFHKTLSIAKNNKKLEGLKSMAQYVEYGHLSCNDLPDLQRIEDMQFSEELQFLCVKFSSLSRAMQIMDVLSGYLLNRIQTISLPTEEILKSKFEIHKQELLQSAYSFISNCKQEINQCIQRSVHHMVYQLLSVQNGAYFKLKLYLIGRVSCTTAIKIGLFHRIADYMNVCSDHLREKDFQIIVREIAKRFALHMRQALIGYSLKPPRVFRHPLDTQHIVQDFEECSKLFSDFGLSPSENDKQHPLYPYFECVALMKLASLDLMQKHMVLMAERNQRRKAQSNRNHNQYFEGTSISAKHLRAKAILDKAVVKKIYDSAILHVLTHRAGDEAALCYVENFVQYRHRNKPLIIDLSDVDDMFRVIIHEGKDLPALDVMDKTDAYCVVNVMPFKLKKETRVVRQSLNPTWDQALDFKISKLSQHIIIEFDVYDCDMMDFDRDESKKKKDHIGKYTERIVFGQANIEEKWVFLYNKDNNKVNGRLLISIECENLWSQ